MIDAIQKLLEQAADSVSIFGENSRYRYSETAIAQLPDGRQVCYLRRRFLPQPEVLGAATEHTVRDGDRLDNLAQAYYGDPELFWQICDSNRALRPDDLTDDPSPFGLPRRIRIGLPGGTALPRIPQL
jgi:nucleoid-associated protein YgaU